MTSPDKKRIIGIRFGALTDVQIRSLGVVEVTESTLHTKGVPKAGGPADTRFGTCSRFYRCGTCKNSVLECPSHPGYITFPIPIPNVAFLQYLPRMMNLHCFNCSAFLLPGIVFPSHVSTPKKKLSYAYDEAKKSRARKRTPLMCPNPECCMPQPTIRLVEPFFELEWADDALEQHFGSDVLREVRPTWTPARPSKRRKKKGGMSDIEEEETPTSEEIAAVEADRARRRAEYQDLVSRRFTNWDAYNMLRSIKKSDLILLGIDPTRTHPEGFMLKSMLVPTINVRPTVSFEEGSKRRGYHPLTRKISEIVKQKRQLLFEANAVKFPISDPDYAGEIPETVVESIKMFYVTVSHYLIKDRCNVPNLKLSPYAARAHARAQSLGQNLGGKKGRYRDSVVGKRVDFCLRTVVTPAPDADVDQIGVPRELARRLTIPIRVNAANREELRKLIAAGDALQVVNERTGDMIAIGEHNKNSIVLMDGWVVERFLADGDIIPINRQPTLHRPSFMGHRVYLHNDRTLKLPYPTTTPYNADHDGDEMNGHIPQTPEARAEIQELMHVPNHIIHPRANKPIIGLIQDALDSGYFMSRQDALFDKAEASQLLMTIRYDRDANPLLRIGDPASFLDIPHLPPPAILRPRPLWTGKQLFSCVIPRVSIERTLKSRQPPPTVDKLMAPDGRLLIRDGELLRGTLCKQSLGTTPGGIVHMACMYRSNQAAARFLSDGARMLNKHMISLGFSIGLSDCTIDPEMQSKIRIVNTAAERHIKELMTMGEEMKDDPYVAEAVEDQIRNTLKTLLAMVGNLVGARLTDANAFNVMASIAGSKGSAFNMAQVMGMVGQTFVNGMRPTASGSDRVLPSAPLSHQPNDLDFEEELSLHGMVPRPYKTGMRMLEAFMNNMGGREGLVDTAAKTSGTGYFQRRLMKSMESHKLDHDGTVRDAYNTMYQIRFGVDGMDPMRTIRVRLDHLLLDDRQLYEATMVDQSLFDPTNPAHHAASMGEWEDLVHCRDAVRRGRLTPFRPTLDNNLDVYLPWDIQVLINRIKPTGRMTPDQLLDAIEQVQALTATLEAEVPCSYAVFHIRTQLSQRNMYEKLGYDEVTYLVREILQMHRDARLQPGEGVGPLTATSVGEPLSQMTLNSVAFTTRVTLKTDVGVITVTIGKWIDTIVTKALQEQRPGIRDDGNGTIWVPLDEVIYVPSCDASGIVEWDRIEAVTRHPVKNDDGSKDLVRVTTESKRTVDVTMGESLVRLTSTGEIQPCRADKLRLTDKLPVTLKLPESDVITEVVYDGKTIQLDATAGQILGQVTPRYYRSFHLKALPATTAWLTHYGINHSITNDNVFFDPAEQEWLRKLMCLPQMALAPMEYVRPFIEGQFGIREGTRIKKAVAETSYELEGLIETMLRRLGVPHKTMGYRGLTIQRQDLEVPPPPDMGDVLFDKVKEIKRIKYLNPWVYDLTVDRTRNMQMANGLIVRDSFHAAGAAKTGMTHGIPRMKEIIGASRNMATPLMSLPINSNLANPQQAAELLARSLPETILRNVVSSTRLHFSTSWLDSDVVMTRRNAPFLAYIKDRALNWMIRITIDKSRAGVRSLEPRGIADLIQNHLQDGALVLSSRAEEKEWIIRVYLVDSDDVVNHALNQSMESGTTRTANKRASQRPSIAARRRRKYADLSSISTNDVVDVPLHLIDPTIGTTKHGAREVVEWMVVRNVEQDLMDNLRICGMENVKEALVRTAETTEIDANTGAVFTKTTVVVDAFGSNLAEAALLHAVDGDSIVTNDIMAVFEAYGITAAAHVLFNELSLCLSASGSRVDERLIKLVVDVMTHNGFVMPISRHGLNRLVKHGVLAKATFEETLEMLFEAAAFGYTDPLLGVSENTMIGRQAKMGTNLSQMFIEEEGERVPCAADARAQSSTTDTRVLRSIVTERAEDSDSEDDETGAERDDLLTRLLSTRVTDLGSLEAATEMPAVPALDEVYETHLLQLPKGRKYRGMPPLLDDEVPFRPSSPDLGPEIVSQVGGSRPFCPSSPTFSDF